MDTEATTARPRLNVIASRGFYDWLERAGVSLALTTYQAGKLVLIGRQPTQRLGVFERRFDRCMGLWSDGHTLWMSARHQMWRLENASEQIDAEGYDRLYVPRIGYTTGDVDVHDVAVRSDGRPVFVCTLFNCLATVSDCYSFEPLWRPPFISKLAAEDRCHLNGLAMRDGEPRYVSACSRSDVVDGWRDHRTDGGCVVDVASNEVIATGFSMPHSPRWHDDRLWLLDSGNGSLGFLDPDSMCFERVAFLPGYARGLAFVGNHAIVGVSRPKREEQSFHGLPLEDELRRREAEPQCGLHVIDLDTGDTIEWVRLEGGLVQELYDVAVLPGVVRPKAIGFKTDEIQRHVAVNDGERLRTWRGAETRS